MNVREHLWFPEHWLGATALNAYLARQKRLFGIRQSLLAKGEWHGLFFFFLWVRHQGPGQRKDDQTKDT